MRNDTDHILFAGGGTAGHLFPGLAVADQMRRHAPEMRITFAGTGKSLELELVNRAGFDYFALPCRPFPRRATEALRFLRDNVAGYYAARRYVRDENVGLVVGLGGYASVPAARAAAASRIAYVLLEQNAVPGRATRWLAPAAAVVCSTFAGSGAYLKSGCRVRVTGNPLRHEFVEHGAPARNLPDRLGGRRTLLVLGGSGGAQTLNEQVPRALYKAGAVLHGWQIVHQAGERHVARTAQLYRKLGIVATVSPFIDELPRLLRSSHLAISRAGGTTLAELAASALPAIVLPYTAATDNHQRKNADVFAAAGATRTIDEREVEGRLDNHLAQAVIQLASDHPLRVRMAQAIGGLARPQATRQVASAIVQLLEASKLSVA
jgi:UDP-N-acetylglucosamine--N-acetylmuramyl-(pentapeptide) pyrophosphoryl-undecaprenol N-acetylglucosamine transferase